MRDYKKGDTVELKNPGPPNLSLGKAYKVDERVYRGGAADIYVLTMLGDDGKPTELEESWFRLVSPHSPTTTSHEQ